MKIKSIVNFPKSLVFMLLMVLVYHPNEAKAQQSEVTNLNVFSASSLTNALLEIEPLYEQSRPNVDISYNFAASGVLLNQILGGAPADVFFSAAPREVNELGSANFLLEGTRQNVLNNRLAIVLPAFSELPLSSVEQLTNAEVTRIAIGTPSTVPAGEYAQQLLNNLGLYEQLEPKLVFGNNVREVLNLVETGSVDAGFVYITDALQSSLVRVATIPPTDAYSPVIYPIAVLQQTSNPELAIDFTNFLSSPEAISVFERFGFTSANTSFEQFGLTLASATPTITALTKKSDRTSVPEPNLIISLIGLGALGVSLGAQSKKNSNARVKRYSITPDLTGVSHQ